MNIIEEIKNMYKNGSVLIRIIFINVSVFLVTLILSFVLPIFSIDSNLFITNWFAVPAGFGSLLLRPWTLISYMFLHLDFLHIAFNMLWLFWFGQIFLLFRTSRELLNTYLAGGIAGAILYILLFNLILGSYANDSIALGASASVMAVVFAIAVYKPDFVIHLLLLGPVKIKYIALVTIAIDIFSVFSVEFGAVVLGENAGGHIAHIGGALWGYYYAMQIKKGKNAGKTLDLLITKVEKFFDRKPKLKVTYRNTAKMSDYEYNKSKMNDMEIMDSILDKIKKSGYSSLTKEEKEILFRMSNKK